MRPIDILEGAWLPYGDENHPRRQERRAKHDKTLEWEGFIRLSDYDDVPYQGDLNLRTYPGSRKERSLEEALLEGTAFQNEEERPTIEVDFDGSVGLSQGNHRTYSMRKLRDEGRIGDVLVPMRIIYYGGRELDPKSWYPKNLVKISNPTSMVFVDPIPEENWNAIGWVPNFVDRQRDYELLWMTPKDFHRFVDPAFSSNVHYFEDTSASWLEDQALEEKTFAPLQAWATPKELSDLKKGIITPPPYNADFDSYVRPHEGRHRAWVARKLGVQKVPVVVWNLQTVKYRLLR